MNKLISLSGSAPLDEVHFRSARLHEALSENSTGTVYLESDSATLNADDFLGKNLCLAFETREQSKRYFDGVIVEMEQVSMATGGRCAYRLELKSWTWLLGKNQEFRVYQNKNIPAIVAEVIARHGHPSVRFIDRSIGAKRVWEYVVQYGESDLNFIRRILEQEGVYFYFENANNSHTLVLIDSSTAHASFPGYDSLTYDPAAQGGRLTPQEIIASMAMRKSIEPPRHAHTDYNFKTPSSSLLVNSQGKAESYNSAFEVFEYPGEYENEGEGAHYSQLRHEEAQARQLVFNASTAARGVSAGYLLKTVCKDNPAFSKSLLIVSTRIGIHESEPEANGGAQSDFDCQFEAIESSQPFRPERKTRKPQVRGPLPALVVGPEGREIHTDEFGRIKIQFYWDRYGLRNENSSCWVRVASLSAGKGWGFVAIPRIGQEVVVSFEDGDPDRPLVTGMSFNAEQTPPYSLPGNKTVSGLRSQSSEKGSPSNFNELRFDDKLGSEYVWFQAEKDYMSLIKNNSSTEIRGNSNSLLHGNLIEEIKADVSRTVLGQVSQQIDKALSLTANDDVLATVQGLFSLMNNGQITISTAGQCSLKSRGSTDVDAVGNLNLSTDMLGNVKAGVGLKLSAGLFMSLNVGASSIVMTPVGIKISSPSITYGGGAEAEGAGGASPTPPESALAPSVVEPPVDPLS
ncbi:type VI secretion system Vgr family protein [Limnobacter parvus]|uniref:Type VI secretion system tip protein VgrG n=1 Tax=Limnobacter parvus TaxID=2939690 RepID=A0ABT1XIQ9_9BURK|nr:type VI secretion system tip protein TssI/VgrG [Limnobacter parvus]MCR2747162.1 type VI secretion system tip protein VgrG [Limnobacter parvus]